MTAETNTSQERPRPPRARAPPQPVQCSSFLPRPSPVMLDALRDKINNPSVCASWHLLDACARALFLHSSSSDHADAGKQ